jgi:hypothetical protein
MRAGVGASDDLLLREGLNKRLTLKDALAIASSEHGRFLTFPGGITNLLSSGKKSGLNLAEKLESLSILTS